MSDSLWSHGLQHTRLLCPPLSRCTYTTNLKILYHFSGFDDVWNCLAFKTFNLLSLLPFLSSVQLLSHVRLFVISWTAACQACLSIISSQNLLRLMSIKSVMPSNHFILYRPLLSAAVNLSQHQGLFQWVSSSHQVAKVLEFQLQHQSFQWIFRIGFL